MAFKDLEELKDAFFDHWFSGANDNDISDEDHEDFEKVASFFDQFANSGGDGNSNRRRRNSSNGGGNNSPRRKRRSGSNSGGNNSGGGYGSNLFFG